MKEKIKGFFGFIAMILLFTYCYFPYKTPQQRKFDDCIQRVAGRQIGQGVKEAQIICLREQ